MSNAKRWSLAVILGASALTSAGGAGATHRPHPGLVCVEQGDSTPEITYEFFGAVRNGGSQQWILCPIVRFNPSSSMDVDDWEITVDRRGSATAWTVTLWSTNTLGASGFSSVVNVPASPSSGAFPVNGGFISNAFPNGMLFVETLMPAGAEIRRLTVDEV